MSINYPEFKNKHLVFFSILKNGKGWPYHQNKNPQHSDFFYLDQFCFNNSSIGTERLVFDGKQVLFIDYQKWLLSFVFNFKEYKL